MSDAGSPWPIPGYQWPPGGISVAELAHCRKQLDFADRIATAQQHHQTVDADADAARRRHSVFQGEDEVLVIRLGLLVPALAILDLLLEAGALVVRVVQ